MKLWENSIPKRSPTNTNPEKLKKAQRELINAYQKEQLEYCGPMLVMEPNVV